MKTHWKGQSNIAFRVLPGSLFHINVFCQESWKTVSTKTPRYILKLHSKNWSLNCYEKFWSVFLHSCLRISSTTNNFVLKQEAGILGLAWIFFALSTASINNLLLLFTNTPISLSASSPLYDFCTLLWDHTNLQSLFHFFCWQYNSMQKYTNTELIVSVSFLQSALQEISLH